jgi:hypothetical protein
MAKVKYLGKTLTDRKYEGGKVKSKLMLKLILKNIY